MTAKTQGHTPVVSVSQSQVWTIVLALAAAASVVYGFLVDWDATVPAIAAFFAAMAVASVIDLKERRVPNRFLAMVIPPIVGLFVVAAIVNETRPLVDALVGGVVLFGIFLAIYAASKGSFGAGDVKISFLIGVAVCWFGLNQIVWLLVWMWIGLAAVGIPILRREGRGTKASLPFVPILSVASALTILIAAA